MDITHPVPKEQTHEALKRQWIDQFVSVKQGRSELARFDGLVGRVVAINWNDRALVDFQDGGWYDISPEFLAVIDPAEGKARYNPKANSAQPYPDRQG